MFLSYTLKLLKNGHLSSPCAKSARAVTGGRCPTVGQCPTGAPSGARTYPPSFVDNGPKLRVLILVIREWPEMAQNKDEPWKMTQTSEKEFFRGGPNGKVVALGILVICSVDKNRDHHTKNWLFAPNIQKGTHPCTSSLEQGGGKRVLEAFF